MSPRKDLEKKIQNQVFTTIKTITKSVRFVPEGENLPESDPEAPDIRLEIELPRLEILYRHPGVGDQLARGLLITCNQGCRVCINALIDLSRPVL